MDLVSDVFVMIYRWHIKWDCLEEVANTAPIYWGIPSAARLVKRYYIRLNNE